MGWISTCSCLLNNGIKKNRKIFWEFHLLGCTSRTTKFFVYIISLSLSPPSKCYHLMAPVLMINSWFVLTMWLFGGTAFLLSQLLSISLVLTVLFLVLLFGVVALVFFFMFNSLPFWVGLIYMLSVMDCMSICRFQ